MQQQRAALFCSLAIGAALTSSAQTVVPEQIHISLSGRLNEMVVSWGVRSSCSPSMCRAEVAFSVVNSSLAGSWAVSTDVVSQTVLTETQAVPLRIINVRLSGLQPNRTYFYACGGVGSGAPVLSFVNGRLWTSDHALLPTDVPPEFGPRPPVSIYSVTADLGLTDGFAIPRMLRDASRVDTFVIAGDLAYDLFTSSGLVGDNFMRALQPLVGSVPFHVAPGNHECQQSLAANCFVQYNKRFSGIADTAGRLSGSGNALWYSWDHGLVHWVAIDTELWFYFGSTQNVSDQLAWLQEDLMGVNRSATPFVIAMGHKQAWMDKLDRQGFVYLEEVLQRGGADLYITGHSHNYQRLLPQWNNVVASACVSPNRRFYTNCPSMTTLVVGSPGNKEGITFGRAPTGVATQWYSYALGYVYVLNRTHLYFRSEEVADINGTLYEEGDPARRSDDVWLVKTTPRALSLPVITPSGTPSSSVTPTATDTPAPGANITGTPSPSASVPPSPTATSTASPLPVLAAWTFESSVAALVGASAASAVFTPAGAASFWSTQYTSGAGVPGSLAATLTSFPAQGTLNATSGVRFCMSTVGFMPSLVTVDLQASNSGAQHRVVQYQSPVSGVWVDVPSAAASLTAGAGGQFFSYAIDIPEAAGAQLSNAVSACLRVVTAFAPNRTTYAAATSTSVYATTGTLRVDNLVVHGSAVAISTPSSTPAQTVTPPASPMPASSATRTHSSTRSATPSATVSGSLTATRSSTATPSATVSGSLSASITSASSASRTVTGTSSGSATPPASVTSSPTGTSSKSFSGTASVSGTGTAAPSARSTGTPSASGTGTPAPSGSASASPASSQATTPSKTHAGAFTQSRTGTRTWTRTRTASRTRLPVSKSATASRSRTRKRKV